MAAEHEDAEQENGGQLDAEEYQWLQQQLVELCSSQGIDLKDVMDDEDWQDPYGGRFKEAMRACEAGDEEAVKSLIEESSIDVNQPGPDGDTLLHLVSLYGHLTVVKLLLDKGAEPAIVNQTDGSTPHHDAAAGGFLEILQILYEKAPDAIHMVDEDGETPLHLAARGDHKEVVQFLLKQGADPTVVNQDGHTPEQEAEDVEVKAILAVARHAA